MKTVVLLEWTFSPVDYFEELIRIDRGDYVMAIADGKVEARIDASLFDKDPSLRQNHHAALNDRFLGVQLLTHHPYTLSNSAMTRLHPDGRRELFVEAAILAFAEMRVDVQVLDEDGSVVSDSRQERIDAKRNLSELVATHRVRDTFLGSLLHSYHKSVNDPENELIHLYEIRDALSDKFGGDGARDSLGISASDWSTMGRLANKEPLRQGGAPRQTAWYPTRRHRLRVGGRSQNCAAHD
jgi:hypothetical protein